MTVISEQQRLYAEARFSGLGKREAAIAAGCPAKTASQAATRLEKHPNVAAHLARLEFAGTDSLPPEEREARQAGVALGSSEFNDPKEMLRAVMNEKLLDIKIRMQAATTLMPYEHEKCGERGKKEKDLDKAKGAGGVYQRANPPRLTLIG